jgi:type IV secretory pathway VirJ component
MNSHSKVGRACRAALGALAASLCAMAAPGRAAQVATAPEPATATPSASSASSAEPAGIAHGLFTGIRVVRPHVAARQFVMLVTADIAPSAREQAMLRALLAEGAMVATVPLAPFYRRLAAQDGKCTYGPGAFENLSRHLQAFEHLPGYLVPILVGADDASSYVYAVLAQAPAATFAAGLLLGFSPRLELQPPPCVINALRGQARAASGVVDLAPPPAALTSPWVALPDESQDAATVAAARSFVQRVPQATWVPLSAAAPMADFASAYRRVAIAQVPLGAPPQQLSDLPIVEVPATGSGTRFAVLLSGDGGWAGIDKSLGSAIAAQGIPVAGFDSLRYFWSARTPDQLAADLDRIIRYYAARWGRSDVLLVGYSQGADVLPFALNRLPAATRARVRLAALLGPGQKASFEFHLTNWMGPSGDRPIAPEARKLSAASTLCIYGVEEKDSLCPELAPDHARAMPLSGGHHFGGQYDVLAGQIIEAMPK